MSKFLLFVLCLGFVSCAGLFHHRSFVDQMNAQEPFYRPGEDFPVSAGDSGKAYRNGEDIKQRTPMDRHEKAQVSYNRMLSREKSMLEAKLDPSSLQDYKKHSHYLETDSEKIYYLRLPQHKRIDYLSSRRLASASSYSDHSEFGNHRKPASVLDRELFLGMGKSAVISSWGRPHRVDIAGNPRHENERWSFYVNGRIKTVFFEAGKVQGWATE